MLLSESAAKKKTTLEVLCDKLLTAVLDKEMIAIVLRNLISNAIKISITDYGVGISEEDIPKLFKLDKNVSTSDTDGEQGSGMGLILCNDIVKNITEKYLFKVKKEEVLHLQ